MRHLIIRKLNALLSLMASLLTVIHVGYSAYCYLTFYYNPGLKELTAIPMTVITCLHAFLGMALVFTLSDGTRLDLYPKQNLRTVLQRISAALIFPLLMLHIRTYSLLKTVSAAGQWTYYLLLLLAQALFYAAVFTHIGTSLSRALITLGWLSSKERQKKLDCAVYILCALLFAAAVYAVVKGELAMFPLIPSAGGAS